MAVKDPTRDAIAGLSERLRQMPSSLNDACRTMEEAATQLDAQAARVKELEGTTAEALARMMDAQMKIGAYQGYATGSEARAKDMEARAARAEQERDEAYERAALVVERWSLPTIQTPSMWLVDKAGIAAAIRRLAAGDEKENL